MNVPRLEGSVASLGRWIIVILCTGLFPEGAGASFECPVTTSQPIFVEDCGCHVIADVTYVESRTWIEPGYEVNLITRPNRMLHANGEWLERNAAHQEGLVIQADVPDAMPGKEVARVLDTLRVRLDVTAAVERARGQAAAYRAGRDSVAAFHASTGDTATARRIRQYMNDYPADRIRRVRSLVLATLDCIVDAASRSRIPIRFVTTTVHGDRDLAKLSRTVAVPARSPHHAQEY